MLYYHIGKNSQEVIVITYQNTNVYKNKPVDGSGLMTEYDKIKSGHLEEKLEAQLKL